MSISTASPGLGKKRSVKSPYGMVCIQARAGAAFMPGSTVAHRAGVQLGEVPLSATPRPDLVVLGEFIGNGLFAASSTADANGGAVDADGNPQMITVRPGTLGGFATGTGVNAITAACEDRPCFMYDDDTMYLTDLGGTLSFGGFVDGLSADGKVTVRAGIAERTLYSLFSSGQSTPGFTQSGDARAVITTIAAYTGTLTGTLTGTANGAIGAQDTSETLVAGDVVYLPLVTGGAGGATVAGDEGPYTVSVVGTAGTKFVLTRPAWWAHGAKIKAGATVTIQFGAIWAGNAWRSFPATALKVVGTDATGAYPRTWSGAFLIGTTAAITTAWIRSVNRLATTNITGARAFGATTLGAGAGTGTLTIAGTAADTIEYCAINF